MKMMSFVKVAVLTAAVVLPASFTVATAKTMLPPGACAVGKKSYVASSSFCSYDCDPKTNWCSQQLCANGTLTKVLSCYGSFCSVKCGG